MPIYIATLSSCDCTPIPEMVFRAEDMVSAVMTCQEKLEVIRTKAVEAKVELHGSISVISISEADFELFDEAGIEDVVSFWKEVVEK